MHLVAPLIGGVRGAENGSATFRRRGTASTSRVFGSFEGIDPDESGDPVPLDAFGGVEVYVDTMTTVRVSDKDGNLVREFVSADSAPAIEVRSKAFSGQEYGDGSGIKPGGGGQPTTLQAVLDLWETVNLAKDWKVGNGQGAEITLPDLIASLLNQSIDVTSPEFGAKGNLINDDLSAFVKADIEATSRGGATILAPSNIGYRWSNTFTLGPLNNLLGLNPGGTLIRIDAAGNPAALSLGVGGVGRFVSRIRFASQPLHTGVLIKSTGKTLIGSCVFNVNLAAQGNLVQGEPGSDLRFIDCDFHQSSPTTGVYAELAVTDKTRVSFTRCNVFVPVGAYTGKLFRHFDLSFIDSKISAPSGVANVGNAYDIFFFNEDAAELNLSSSVFALGTQQPGDTGADEGMVTGIRVAAPAQGVVIHESGCTWRMFERLFSLQVSGENYQESSFETLRKSAVAPVGHAVDNPVLAGNAGHQSENVGITRTASTDFAIDLVQSGGGVVGKDLYLSVTNSSGGNITNVSFTAPHAVETESVTNGRTRFWHLRSIGLAWFQVGASYQTP